MPLDDHGVGTRVGWLHDRFGVSWQLDPACALRGRRRDASSGGHVEKAPPAPTTA